MKDLDYYLSLPYKLEIVPDTEEGGYAARYPDLPGCITCGETLEAVSRNAEDAKRAWLEAALEDSIAIKEPVADAPHYSGQFKLRIPKTLHQSLATRAKDEGLSMNQYCLYLLSQNNALYHIS